MCKLPLLYEVLSSQVIIIQPHVQTHYLQMVQYKSGLDSPKVQ